MINRLRGAMRLHMRFSFEDLAHEEGQTTAEWGMVVALVIVLALFAFSILTPIMGSIMHSVGSAIVNALP